MKIETDGKLHHVVPFIVIVLDFSSLNFELFKLADICMLEPPLSLIFY